MLFPVIVVIQGELASLKRKENEVNQIIIVTKLSLKHRRSMMLKIEYSLFFSTRITMLFSVMSYRHSNWKGIKSIRCIEDQRCQKSSILSLILTATLQYNTRRAVVTQIGKGSNQSSNSIAKYSLKHRRSTVPKIMYSLFLPATLQCCSPSSNTRRTTIRLNAEHYAYKQCISARLCIGPLRCSPFFPLRSPRLHLLQALFCGRLSPISRCGLRCLHIIHVRCDFLQVINKPLGEPLQNGFVAEHELAKRLDH